MQAACDPRELQVPAAVLISLGCSAGLLALLLPSAASWPLAWLVPAPLLFAARNRSIAAAGGVLGAGIACIALALAWWMPWTMIRRFGTDPCVAVTLWCLGALSHVPAAALLGALSQRVGMASPLYPSAVGLGWGVMELSWETVLPGLPSWMALGATQVDTSLAPLAQYIGAYGVSALVAAGSAAALQWAVCGRPRAIPAALVAAAAIWTCVSPVTRPVGDIDARLALIQPGSSMPRVGEGSAYQRELLDSLIAQTRALREPVRFVLWPEGVLLDPLGDRPDLLREIQALVDERGLHLILGSARRGARQRHVSALLLRPGRDAAVIYDKQRLVPFAEAWPDWAPLFLRARLGRMAPVRAASPGAPPATPVPFELSLCWESAFSARVGRAAAGMLVSLVNDGWYDDTPAAAQTLLLSRWRAIERGAWLVRVATTGVSAVISPEGRVVAKLGVGQRGALLAPLARSSSETAFERAGYRPLCFACLSVVAVAIWRRAVPTRPAMRKHEG